MTVDNNVYVSEGLREALDGIDTVLDQDLQRLTREKHDTKIARWMELSKSFDEFNTRFPPDWTKTLRDTIRSRFRLAQLLLAASFPDGVEAPAEVQDFTPTEISLLRDFERYSALDRLSEDEIAEAVLDHRQTLFELASDFYHKQYPLLDVAMANPSVFETDLAQAFMERYGGRFEKVKGALTKIDPQHIDEIMSLTPEKIEALSTLSIETLIAISGPIQSKLLKDLAITQSLSDADPSQIVAIGALNNPAFSDVYREILVALARNGSVKDYERLISEIKEGSQIAREDNQRNVQTLVEMFHKAVDSLRDTITVLASAFEAERPDLSAHTAPDGTVTIIFTDIEASTEMFERLGDQAAQEVLRRHNDTIRQQVETFGGFEVKSLGDGFMLAFAGSHRAVQCAVAVQQAFAGHRNRGREEPVKVRIGIHIGEPIKEADDFYGQCVITAARIAGQAVGSEILVSSLLKELTGNAGDIRFGQGRDVMLKGLTGSSRVFPVEWT